MPSGSAYKLERLPNTNASWGCDRSCKETSPLKWKCWFPVIDRWGQFNWLIVPLASKATCKFSLKGKKAGTKGVRSQRVMSEGNIRKEKRTSLVKFLKAPKLSYSMRMVSIASEVFGKSIAKFSMLIFWLFATILRLSFFNSKPEFSSSMLRRFTAALTESFWSAFNEILAMMFRSCICCALNFPGVSSADNTL